jgi:hypothetical protein
MANKLNFFRGEYSKFLELVENQQIVATNLYFTVPDATPKENDKKSSSFCVFHGTNLLASATHEADLNKVIGDVSALTERINNISSELATYTISAITVDDKNVKEAYQLIKTVGETSEGVGEVIKVYNDSALKDVKLVNSGKTQYLSFTYTLADNTESTVEFDVSSLLVQSEFKNGLLVNENGEVSVKLGADSTTNKNFLTFEGNVDGEKALAVRSMDTDCTVTTQKIIVAGGPLDSTSLRNILPKDADGNAYISGGTNVQSLLMSLFTKVNWPAPTLTEGKISTSIGAPRYTLKNGTTGVTNNSTIEVGTDLTMSEATLSTVSSSTTARTFGEFTYGYSSASSFTDISTANTTTGKSISVSATSITVNSSNYTMSSTFTGFTQSGKTATPSQTASAVTLSSGTCRVIEGSNKVTVSVGGPKGVCTFGEIPSKFICSNVKTFDASKKTAVQSEKTVTATTAPSNSKSITVTGSYKYFMGGSQSQDPSSLDSDAIRGLGKNGWVTQDGTTSIGTWTSPGYSAVIACPSKYKLATITDSMGNSYLGKFSKTATIAVKTGAINTNYTVYMYPLANNDKMDFKNITLTKA